MRRWLIRLLGGTVPEAGRRKRVSLVYADRAELVPNLNGIGQSLRIGFAKLTLVFEDGRYVGHEKTRPGQSEVPGIGG